MQGSVTVKSLTSHSSNENLTEPKTGGAPIPNGSKPADLQTANDVWLRAQSGQLNILISTPNTPPPKVPRPTDPNPLTAISIEVHDLRNATPVHAELLERSAAASLDDKLAVKLVTLVLGPRDVVEARPGPNGIYVLVVHQSK